MHNDKKNLEVSAQILQAMMEDGLSFSQVRAYTGDVLYTEKMAGTQVYLIKEGQVDLYLMREERRVVVESLGKGQCFGMNSSLLNRGRAANAAAATYSEFYVIDAATLESYLNATPKVVRAMLTTLAGRLGSLSEVIATRVNYQPEIQIYAQLLQILGMAELGRKLDSRTGSDKQVIASVVLTDFFGHAKGILGHSDPHIRHTVGKLLSLHLVRMEDDGNGKRVFFSPKDIVNQARKLAAHDKDKAKVDYEYITVEDFAAMVEVDRGLLLTKLARSEFSEDIFTFRKSEIMRLLDTKGRKFFADRKIKTPSEFVDIDDIEFADQRSIVEVLSAVDAFDLAKVISRMEEGKAKEKIMACLPRSKREEVDSDMKGLSADPVEANQLGQRIIGKIKDVMLGNG